MLIGDIGGVLEVLLVVFGALAASISSVRLEAVIANRLYYLNSSIEDEFFEANTLTEKNISKNRLIRNSAGLLQINVPYFIGL